MPNIESLITLRGKTKEARADSLARQVAKIINESDDAKLKGIRVGSTNLYVVHGMFRRDGANHFAEFLKGQHNINTRTSAKRLMIAYMRKRGFKSHTKSIRQARQTLQVTRWHAMSPAQKRSPAGKQLGRSVKAIMQNRRSQRQRKKQH
jgi:hypothetical protein